MVSREWEQFGPWVLRVLSEEDVPRLFRDHGLDLAAQDVVLAVPRPLARRDVAPGMDLYDQLVALGPGGLTVLSRLGTHRTVVDPADVVAVSNGADLLDGRLVLHGVGDGVAPADGWGRQALRPGQALVLRYNGTSRDLMEDLGVRLRRAAGRGPGAPSAARVVAGAWGPALDALGPDDVALVTALRELHEVEHAVERVALQPRSRVPRVGVRLADVRDRLRPVTREAVVLAATAGEVHVLHRSRGLTTGSDPAHSLVHTVLPRGAGGELTVRAHPAADGVALVRYARGTAAVELVTAPDGPVLAALRDLLP